MMTATWEKNNMLFDKQQNSSDIVKIQHLHRKASGLPCSRGS